MSGAETIRARLAPAIAALVVGLSGGYVIGGVAHGTPEAARPTERSGQKPEGPVGRSGMDHSTMRHGASPVDTPAARAYRDASVRMHAAMNVAPTGDADLDFAAGMIPHHRGAVDMARIELEHGSDPEMRRLAAEVVRTQEAEISTMRTWVDRRRAR